MSLRNANFDMEDQEPLGLDTTSPIAVMKPGYVRQAANVDVGLSGGYTKRDGYTNLSTVAWGARSITAGIEYETLAGSVKTVVFGTDGTASGGIIADWDTTAPTNISTGLSGTTRPYFVQFDSRLFFFNGVDSPILYDGGTPRQVGITAPTVQPTFSSENMTGELTLLSSYVIAYTYYNSITGAESTPSELSDPHTLTGANDAIVWNIAAGSSATADTIRVYRTVGNGNTLFLDGTTGIGSTTYTSTVADAGLGRQIELDNSRIVDLSITAQFPTVADNRIFVMSDSNEVRWSKLGQEGPMPESYEAKAFTPTMGRFGTHDKIVGLNRINQLPIVLKQNSIGRLDPIGLPNNIIAEDNVSYQYREITDAVGGICHGGAAQVYDELVWIAKDNIYATNGITVRPLANTIQATVRLLGTTSTQRTRISCINDVDKRKLYIAVFSSNTATHPSTIIVGDYQVYPNFKWTTYEPGPNTTTHPGITAACLFSATSTTTGRQLVYFGNDLLNGKLYRLNNGTNDDTKAIYMKIISRPYWGPSRLLWKLYKKVEMNAEGDGSNYNLTLAAIYNLTSLEEDALNLSLFSNSAVYDAITSLYDTTLWAGETLKELEYFMHRRAKYMQLVIKQTEADAPVSIFTWGVYESVMGPFEGPEGL